MKDKGALRMTNQDHNNSAPTEESTLVNSHEGPMPSSDEQQSSELASSSAQQQTIEESTLQDYEQKTAGFWMRFWAFSLDSLIIVAIVGVLVNPIFYLMDWSLNDMKWYAPISIISAVIYYVYFVLMTYYFNQTLGKMVFGLRVTTLNNEKLSLSTVIFREWIGRFISNTISPLYLLVVLLDKNQGIHDYFADTKVIQENVYFRFLKSKSPAVPVTKQV